MHTHARTRTHTRTHTQEAFPARFKGVHVLNQPWYISIIMTIVRPFLKQKLKERVRELQNMHRHCMTVYYVTIKKKKRRSLLKCNSRGTCT